MSKTSVAVFDICFENVLSKMRAQALPWPLGTSNFPVDTLSASSLPYYSTSCRPEDQSLSIVSDSIELALDALLGRVDETSLTFRVDGVRCGVVGVIVCWSCGVLPPGCGFECLKMSKFLRIGQRHNRLMGIRAHIDFL